ncbi:hypothetical protein CI109_100778 [Kwoniella shandongensis]|uniref:Uncharacterized protein n=1 Tax=Kwoniella shandongensis TaxID=1734106 RepID=A0A5M6BV75_9TREE|nr:uncharacterized protein CI109_005043 [Kwoniella shandongensis]KAA5526653.1 hypothetical protein CI109_005043 [Kwoniella shandongensis]
MADKSGAAPAARPTWNKDEWAAKAKAKDEEGFEHAKAAEAALASGKLPPKRHNAMDDLPKPTKALEARSEALDLNKNLNKTMLVQTTTTGKGPRGAGFYCEMCNRTFKDSLSYLDHVNGRFHLRQLGQTTQVARSTLSQVRAKIASLRASTNEAVTAKNFDFQARLSAVRSAENAERERRREERKRKRENKREQEQMVKMGILPSDRDRTKKVDSAHNQNGNGQQQPTSGSGSGPAPVVRESRDVRRKEKREKAKEDEEVQRAIEENEQMASMMGFGGFTSAKKR